MNLHKLTLDALRHKAQVARDSYDVADEETHGWLETAEALETAIKRGKVAALCSVAKEELDNYLTGDLPKHEITAIVRDLCLSGWFPRHNPNAVTTRRIKTRTYGGIKYDTGF